MYGRSSREGLLACAGLAVVLGCFGPVAALAASDSVADVPSATVPFAAEDSADPLAADSLLADGDPTVVEAADWRPDHAPVVTTAATDRRAEAKTPDKVGQSGDQTGADASDPEPDAIVVPAAPSPSHDPLDKPKPSAVNPAQPDGKAAAAAEEPLPPLNTAVKAALDAREALPIKGPNVPEQRKDREAVAFYYAAHGFAPAWSEKGTASNAVPSVLARLAAADEDALNLPQVPSDLTATGKPEDIAASDVALTEAVVAYARQATGSRIEPRTISPLIGAKPDLADPAEVIDAVVAAGPEAGDKLRALNPTDPRYIALRDKLAEMRGESAPQAGPAIPLGPVLSVGMRDPRVPLLRTRFQVEATSDDSDADLVYDADVAAAVSKFQRANGLQVTGTLSGPTVAALNGRAFSRATRPEATIIANMEMWRWLPHDLGSDRIEVNVPDYLVRVYHDNQQVASNRVVVGKTTTPTPIFSNTMKFLIVNPVWNVPQSIIKKEFGGGTHGFKARYVHGQLFLQQPAGPGNALGRIKFMFPNDYSVYLHDTPAKGLFGASKRAFSHGCVRVDKPFEFAESVLNDGVPEGGHVKWSQKRLQSMLGTTERYVDLPQPLPIHIEYFTASVDDSGRLKTREDIYGYTSAVASALGLRGGASTVAVAGVKPVTEREGRRLADVDAAPDRDFVAADRRARRKARASRRLAERAAAQARQAYAPAAETGRGGGSYSNPFGFLPF